MGTGELGKAALGYLPRDVFFDRLSKRPASVDALLTVMDYPGMPGSVRSLSVEEKLAKAVSQARHLQNELPEYKHLSIDDVLICECYIAFTDDRYKIPGEHFDLIFGPVEEQEMTEPVARFFYKQGYTIFTEVPIGKSRADIVAYNRTGEPRLIAVELKVKVVQLKKCFAQLMDYQKGADTVYLATTPGCVVKYLSADVDEINPRALEEELSRCGAGLVILDGSTGGCQVIMPPPKGEPRPETRDWLARRCDEIVSEAVPMIPWRD